MYLTYDLAHEMIFMYFILFEPEKYALRPKLTVFSVSLVRTLQSLILHMKT